MEKSGKFWAGTSGLVLTEPNKKSFPAEFRHEHRLVYYASKFNSIEINSSFYKIPRGQTYKKWSEMVSEDFRFTVKLWQGITHQKDIQYQLSDLETFFQAINCLGHKKGCLLIQFPASAKFHFSAIKKLLDSIRDLDPDASWRIAVEFRHPQWYHPDMYGILDEYGASMVLHDMPKSIPSKINDGAPFVYLRFHGEKGDYRGSYDNDFLRAKARNIRCWLEAGKDVYVYFNNTAGDAAKNLATLKTMAGPD